MHLKNLFGMSVDDAPFYNMTFENVGRKAGFIFFHSNISFFAKILVFFSDVFCEKKFETIQGLLL